jgi:CheY-like chemotaxis protein
MKTVLIADDEPAIRSLLAIFLGNRYRVIEAATGEEALELAWTERPDLALIDITMPKLSGLEVASRLSADPRTHNLPIVLLSGWGRPEDCPVPIAGYLAKPFKREELYETVTSIIGE